MNNCGRSSLLTVNRSLRRTVSYAFTQPLPTVKSEDRPIRSSCYYSLHFGAVLVHCGLKPLMKTRRLFPLLAVAFFSGPAAFAASPFVTGGVYDTTANTNNIDVNAPFASGTGGGSVANTTTASTGDGASYTTPGPFNTTVSGAYSLNLGGVETWDEVATGSYSSSIFTSYGTSHTKSLQLSLSGSLSVVTGLAEGQTSLSGGQYVDLGAASFTLTMGTISGGLPGEAVTQFGLGFLSETFGSSPLNFGNVSLTAHFSGGGSATETSAINANNTVGDTFYGFVAPAGQSITSISMTTDGTNGLPDIDDIGFVTTAAVPEPATCWMLAIGGAAISAFCRRRRHRAGS